MLNCSARYKMNAKYKKSLKIVSLLITSIIIAIRYVNAYNQLFISGTITITDNRVILINSSNTTDISTNGVENSGTTVTFDSITIAVDELLTYNDAVRIQNNAASTKDFDLTVTSLTGPFSTNFEYVYLTVFDTTPTQAGNQIQMVATGTNVTSTGTISIPNGATWTVQWIIKASVDATASEAISITAELTVQ